MSFVTTGSIIATLSGVVNEQAMLDAVVGNTLKNNPILGMIQAAESDPHPLQTVNGNKFRGHWDSEVFYAKGDTVLYNSGYHVAKFPVKGPAPSSHAFWSELTTSNNYHPNCTGFAFSGDYMELNSVIVKGPIQFSPLDEVPAEPEMPKEAQDHLPSRFIRD